MCLHGLTQPHFITDLVVIVALLRPESLRRYMSFSAPPHSQPRSPLAQKRRRLDPSVHTTSSPMFPSDLDLDIQHGEGEDDGDKTMLPANSREDIARSWGAEINTCTPVGQVPVNATGTTQTPPSPRMQHSMEQLEAASQAVRLRVATKERSDKSTPATYERHVNSYSNWWECYQSAQVNRDPQTTTIPAFPITTAKATMFLDYTSTRPKVSISPTEICASY